MQPDHKGKSTLPRSILTKIQIAAKEIGLDEADYRDLLERVTGKRSASELIQGTCRGCNGNSGAADGPGIYLGMRNRSKSSGRDAGRYRQKISGVGDRTGRPIRRSSGNWTRYSTVYRDMGRSARKRRSGGFCKNGSGSSTRNSWTWSNTKRPSRRFGK